MKARVLKIFAGFDMDGDTRRHISVGGGEIIELPEKGHDFVKAGLVEVIDKPKSKPRRKRATKKAD